MGVFSPDSILWFGVVLGLIGRFFLATFSRAASLLLSDAARRFIEHRAHVRAMQELREDAEMAS